MEKLRATRPGRDEQIRIRVTSKEKMKYEKAASRERVELSVFARAAMDERAEKGAP